MTLSKEELSGLVEMVKGLKGPDREVDGDIALAFEMPPSHLTRREDGWLWYQFVEPDDFDTWEAPPFTASVDAVLALVERVQPGWFVDHIGADGAGAVGHFETMGWTVMLSAGLSGVQASAPTLPLAILLALLLSLQSQEPL